VESKLLGYEFVIEYNKEKENRVVDALSKKFKEPSDHEDLRISLIFFHTPNLGRGVEGILITRSRYKRIIA
jgi:hypothetical protein